MCRTITIRDDEVIESAESFSVQLTASEISNTEPLQVIIIDNDGKGHQSTNAVFYAKYIVD